MYLVSLVSLVSLIWNSSSVFVFYNLNIYIFIFEEYVPIILWVISWGCLMFSPDYMWY